MCMEDVKIGRRTGSQMTGFVCTTSPQQVCGGNPIRFALVLGAPNTGNVTYANQSNGVIGQGINLAAQSGPFHLTLKDHGDIVRDPWWVIGAAGAEIVAIIETILPGDTNG